MVVGFCRQINVQRLEAKKHGFGYCATLFARLVRTTSGVDIPIYLEFIWCIYLNSFHFDKQGQIEYLNTLVTLICQYWIWYNSPILTNLSKKKRTPPQLLTLL